jgi:uncharacterized protein YkuJ
MDSENNDDKLLIVDQIREHNLEIIEAMKKLNERIQNDMNKKFEENKKQMITVKYL